DRLGADVLLQLHEQALIADVHAQRVKRLHLVELVRVEIALAQRRHTQIDERARERRATVAAAPAMCGRRLPRAVALAREEDSARRGHACVAALEFCGGAGGVS